MLSFRYRNARHTHVERLTMFKLDLTILMFQPKYVPNIVIIKIYLLFMAEVVKKNSFKRQVNCDHQTSVYNNNLEVIIETRDCIIVSK